MEIKRDIYLQKLISLLWDGQLTLPTDKSGGSVKVQEIATIISLSPVLRQEYTL